MTTNCFMEQKKANEPLIIRFFLGCAGGGSRTPMP